MVEQTYSLKKVSKGITLAEVPEVIKELSMGLDGFFCCMR
jgi:hypothetical protein